MFSLGRVPYPGLDPVGVVELLDTGGRLHSPNNEACSQEMYEISMHYDYCCTFSFKSKFLCEIFLLHNDALIFYAFSFI